jgi:hypothetical protein
VAVLSDDEGLVIQYVSDLIQVMDRAAVELASASKYGGRIQVVPPQESNDTPGTV